MQKTYLIVNPHGKQKCVTGDFARSIKGQVKVLGEVIETKYKNRGTGEVVTSKEYRQRCFRVVDFVRQDGRPIGDLDASFDDPMTMLKVAAFVLEVNFKDFFLGLGIFKKEAQ